MCLNVSVVKLCLYVSECVCSKIIKELPGLVGSGTLCTCCVLLGRGLCDQLITRSEAVEAQVGLLHHRKEIVSSLTSKTHTQTHAHAHTNMLDICRSVAVKMNLTIWRQNYYFFLISAHSVYKM
jgi:hypothetical protein